MKKYYSIALLVFVAFAFSSCLKDKKVEDQEYGLKGLEDVKLVEITKAPYRRVNLIASDADTTFDLVTVHLNSEDPAPEDITVTLVADQSVIDDYNANNGTSFEFPPSAAYTLDNLTVTIPKGSRDGTVKITTKSSNLTGGQYAFGFSISSISNSSYVLSRNYKSIMTVIGVKNEWDGVYNIHVIISGPNAYAGEDFEEDGYPLTTVNATSVYAPYIADFFTGYEEIEFKNDGSVGVMAGGDSGSPNSYGAEVLESSYDASVHDFHVKYSILGGKYIFDETYTRQ